MKIQHAIFWLLPLFVSLLAVSCKDEEDDTRNYMSGSVTFDLPRYAMSGQRLEVTATGVQSPSSPEYMWVSQEIDLDGSGADTVYGQSISFTLPDIPGEYSLTVFAMSPEYYSLTDSKDIQVINTSSSVMTGIWSGDSMFEDPRDGTSYHTVTYGNLQWFTQNLHYAGTEDAPLGTSYDNLDNIDLAFGRLYTWNEATGGVSATGLAGGPQGPCPDGWAVPTIEDWEDLALAVGGSAVEFYSSWEGLGSSMTAPIAFSGTAMWPYSPNNAHTNSSRWNGIPAGNARDGFSVYENLSSYGMWWAATEYDAQTAPYRYVYYDSDVFGVYNADKENFAVSIRCVRLAQ